MPSYKCPICDEDIKFAPDDLGRTVKKCPHCHEFVRPQNPWRVAWMNIAKYSGRGSFLFPLLGILTPSVAFYVLTHSWWWALFVGAIVFLAFLRPLNIQPAVLISFAAFTFVGLNALWQKDNFELRNRPYIQIVDSSLKISPKDVYRFNANNSKPEPAFQLKLSLANHGPVPASIREILIKGHSEIDKLTLKESIFIGPDSEDKEKQWKNFDVFPKFSEDVTNIWGADKFYFYFNVGDIQKLFGIKLDEKEIIKNAQPDREFPSLYQSLYLSNYAKKITSDFFLVVQLKYDALGERNEKAFYYYWVIYKFNSSDIYSKNNGFAFVESGTNCRLLCDE